jgi:hypothetical protein
MSNKKNTEKSPKYFCEDCQFYCVRPAELERHFATFKHKMLISKLQSSEKVNEYFCECGNKYMHRQGLSRHKKTCKYVSKEEITNKEESDTDSETEEPTQPPSQPLNNIITPELIMMLIQQNKEMQHAMIDMAKNMGNHHNTNSNNNNNNKSFNLNVFLNETCKDAMNMSEFLNRLDVTTYDFEQTGKNGYVDGICRIMENGLNNLEVHERPIHCTDAKRETIYIKDNDKWEKDDDKRTKLVSVIKQVGAKNIKMIPQWCKEHPGWRDPESKENDRYLKYVNNSMCGGTDEEIQKNYGDIARYISKLTVVDKKECIAL